VNGRNSRGDMHAPSSLNEIERKIVFTFISLVFTFYQKYNVTDLSGIFCDRNSISDLLVTSMQILDAEKWN
jgi:hypothetical protein